jgi:hypothetical protein
MEKLISTEFDKCFALFCCIAEQSRALSAVPIVLGRFAPHVCGEVSRELRDEWFVLHER